jgi:hypothetical protein
MQSLDNPNFTQFIIKKGRMSFALQLWDNFDLVNSHSNDRRRSGEDYLAILRDLAGQYEIFARGMDKIGTHSFFAASQGTLFHGISALKNDCLNKAMQSRILAESIINDLIEPMRELLRNQNLVIKKTSAEGKKLEKDHSLLIDRYDKARSRYIRACQECEQVIIALEYSMPQDKRQKLLSRLVSCKKEVDISLKQYQDAIETGNKFRERYQSMMEKILEVYQKQEEQRLEHMKDSLRKLIVYETSYLRNLQYDIDNLAHVFFT